MKNLDIKTYRDPQDIVKDPVKQASLPEIMKELSDKYHKEQLVISEKEKIKAHKDIRRILKKALERIKIAATKGEYIETFGQYQIPIFTKWNKFSMGLLRKELSDLGFFVRESSSGEFLVIDWNKLKT